MPEKERMIGYYESLHERFGYDHRSLDRKDPSSQNLRYSVLFWLVEMMQKKKVSLADIGCGLGHLYGYLKKNKLIDRYGIEYKGIDISPKLIESAKNKYPESNFEVRDILDGYFTDKFDYVFSCGVFNIKFADESEHHEFVKEMLLRMYESCKIGVAVNFLSENGVYFVPGKDPQAESIYYYFRPEDIIRFVRSFTNRFDLRHDYHVGDFTVYMFKEQA